LQQAINTGLVLVNGKEVRSNYKVRPSDEIIIYSDMDPEQTEVVPENIPLNIVYEDESIMVINKPVGMVVHPGSGNYTGTLLNQMSFYDSAFSIQKILDTAQWGAEHRIPINLTLPPLGPFTVSPSISYSERWYGQMLIKEWDPKTDSLITTKQRLLIN